MTLMLSLLVNLTKIFSLTNFKKLCLGLLNKVNLKPWDVVGIWSPNHHQYLSAVYGVLNAGLTITTANPAYKVDEVVYQMKDANAKVLILNELNLKEGLEAAKILKIKKENIFVFGEKKNEGVRTSHSNMIANLIMANSFESKDIKEDDMFIGVLPFYHMYGLGVVAPLAFMNRIGIVVVEKFVFERFLNTLSVYKVTTAHIVPPMAILLAKSPETKKFDLASLRLLISAAAPLGLELSVEVRHALGIPIKQAYGMTELSPISHMTITENIVDGSVGVLVPNQEAQIVNPETGKKLGFNEEGELWLRGPNVMLGYLNNDKATKETIVDGWLHTGDIAKVDENGNFYIVDRLKELIKYKAFQIAPAELEALLLTHPKLADAAVIPVPHDMAGEVPRAYVVKKPGIKCTESEVKEFVAARVANFKTLRGYLLITKAINNEYCDIFFILFRWGYLY
ncbi:hypothetical protein HK099_001971 [Clydaea vesicula]|uniref:Uncharacterized protein n=1 Tax=Clydaea vesicula TaxID=447962 RepID=A0AAD5XZI1_9FUNG|nr:hypothetical protein HK099_001971 [Clydaea vesicula]